MKKAYYKEIDVLKGIGIYLVVLGHLGLPREIVQFIHYFAIPLFFFVSGFVFKPKNTIEFTKEKFKRILLPFYIFSTITFLIYYITSFPYAALTFKDFLIGTLLGIGNDYYLSWNVALWFLPSLFFINVLFNFLHGFFNKNRNLIALIFCLLSLFVLKDRNWTFLPFHVGSALFMVPFFILGSSLRVNYSKIVEILNMNKRIIFVISFLITIVGIMVSSFNSGNPDVRVHMIGDVFFFYLGAFLTILGLLGLSRFMNYKLFTWLGLNSLLIMCIHLQLMEVAFEFIEFFPFPHAYGILITTFIILLCAPFVFLINRFFPVAAGLKR